MLRKGQVGEEARKEGLNSIYQIGGGLLMFLGSRRLSFPLTKLYEVFARGTQQFEESLGGLGLDDGNRMDFQNLLNMNLIKRKHYIYACYLATFSTIPTLHKKADLPAIMQAILAKASMAVGTKVMDNINDEWHTPESAYSSVGRLRTALINGEYESVEETSIPWLHKAGNSALEIASWTGQSLKPVAKYAPFSYTLLKRDVERWVRGQQDSVLYGGFAGKGELPSIPDYLKKISEKGTGSLWADPDLCLLEKSVGGFDSEQKRQVLAVRASSDLLIKSCLIYDDIVDFFYDMKNKTVNSMVILANQKGLITPEQAAKTDPPKLLKMFYKHAIVSETLALGDTIFTKAVDTLNEIPTKSSIIDPKGLEFHCRLLRLFNLRKMVIRDKTPLSLRVMVDSLRRKLSKNLSDDLMQLEKNVHVPSIVD